MNVLRACNSAMARRPVATAMAVTSGKAMLADAMVQTQVEKCEKLDLRRVALFGSFGFAYQGCFQYWMYNKLFERLWPGKGAKSVVSKILASNLISDPVFFFPTFYAFREGLNDRGPKDWGSPGRWVTQGLANYEANWQTDWVNSWTIWFPGYAVNFGLLPVHLRMPFIACVSFGYVSLLSFTRGPYEHPTPTPPPPPPSEATATGKKAGIAAGLPLAAAAAKVEAPLQEARGWHAQDPAAKLGRHSLASEPSRLRPEAPHSAQQQAGCKEHWA